MTATCRSKGNDCGCSLLIIGILVLLSVAVARSVEKKIDAIIEHMGIIIQEDG